MARPQWGRDKPSDRLVASKRNARSLHMARSAPMRMAIVARVNTMRKRCPSFHEK